MSEPNAKICPTGSQEIIFYSQLPPQNLGEALPSLNPSDDSHERSREAGRNARRVGAAKCTRANVSLPLYARALVLCPVITTSKLRGPFNERGGITPRPLYQPSPGGGRAIYKRFYALKPRNISAMEGTDVNSREFIRSVREHFFQCKNECSGRSFLRKLLKSKKMVLAHFDTVIFYICMKLIFNIFEEHYKKRTLLIYSLILYIFFQLMN